jgi:hypothetical protein
LVAANTGLTFKNIKDENTKKAEIFFSFFNIRFSP